MRNRLEHAMQSIEGTKAARTAGRAGKIAALIAAFWMVAPVPVAAAPVWNESPAITVNTTNCITGATEALSTSLVGWFGDPVAPPALNTPYYVRVRWFVTGKPCIGGAQVAPELFLPDGATLAISTTNPVKCIAVNFNNNTTAQEFAACPQVPAVGVRGGLGFYNGGTNPWPTAQGFGWEIHVPILSTTPLGGVVSSTNPSAPCPDCLTGAVWSIDGVSSPSAFPRVGIRTANSTNLPTITYPVPSIMNITDTSAEGSVTLNRAGTTGSIFGEDSPIPPSGSTCNQSSLPVPITAQSPTPITFPVLFSQLDPGSTHYWRICYVTGGRTFWGTTQVFRTTGTPRPRIFSITPDVALPGREVKITGTDLDGASLVTINGFQGPVPATITNVTSTSVTIIVPDATSLVGLYSVTTLGGKDTSTGVFRVGIETFVDSVVVSANNGGTMPNDVTVRFHSTDPAPSPQYECILDGGPFANSCDDGVVFYYDLAPGMHSLSVAARASGFQDLTPVVVPFEIVNVDTTPPDTTLLTGPVGLTNTNSPTFTFSSPEAGATFECRIDTPIWQPCISPRTLTGLTQGLHTFAVRAKDAAFNVDPTPAQSSFFVDSIPPNTILFSITPPPGAATTTSTTATFAFWGINGLRFECSLDGAVFRACRVPATFTALARTAHTFRVRAVDFAGNVDPTPATRSWTITP